MAQTTPSSSRPVDGQKVPKVMTRCGANLVEEGLALAEALHHWQREVAQFEGAVSVLAASVAPDPHDKSADEVFDHWNKASRCKAAGDILGWMSFLLERHAGGGHPDFYGIPLFALQRQIAEHGECVGGPNWVPRR